MPTKSDSKKIAQPWQPQSPLEIAVYTKFEKLFQSWYDAQPDRTGIHVSSIIVSPERFCLRQIVLMQHFPHAKIRMHPPTIRIFLQGWVIHQKWQKLFSDVGIAVETETTHSHSSGATFTPDAVIEILGKLFIVEIKSMNGDAYESMKSVHADAEIQANMYMHLTGIRQSIVLVENKNNQQFKLWVIQYNKALIRPYLKRLEDIKISLEEFKLNMKLPSRHIKCPTIYTSLAKRCPVSEFCFMGKYERKEAFVNHKRNIKKNSKNK
jgi:hypothetical protein